MNLEDRDGEELMASICDSIHCEDEAFFNEVKEELLSRLKTGEKAIGDLNYALERIGNLQKDIATGQKAVWAMEQMDTLWYADETPDEFDTQFMVILLKYKEATQ